MNLKEALAKTKAASRKLVLVEENLINEVLNLLADELEKSTDEIIEAKIVDIDFSPISLSGGGTGYAVKISLPQQTSDLKFKLGLNGNADIIMVKLDEALILPPAAVSQKDGRWTVKIKRGKEYIERNVETGWETEDKVEIKSGLELGDQVYVNK